MSGNIRSLTRGAIIAAQYAVTTILLTPVSFGVIQIRAAEALTLLPILLSEAVPGLFIGCLLGNLLSGAATWFDILFGSLATLLAAVLTRALRNRPLLAALMPVVCNTFIVGPVVYFAYTGAVGIPALLGCCLSVAVGECIACFALGLPLIRLLRNRFAP